MLDEETNAPTRAELLRLTPSGDLLDLARQMRDMGVESLLFCSPSGRIEHVVTDRQIAHLAVGPAQVPTGPPGSAEPGTPSGPADTGPAIPRQAASARADESASASRP